MKHKKIMLASILLLAILTLGAVSATDSSDAIASGDVTGEPLADPDDSFDDGIDDSGEDIDDWGDDDEEFDPIFNPSDPDDGKYVEYNSDKNITFTLPEDAQGTLSVSNDYDWDDDDNLILINPVNYTVTNGKAIIPLKDLAVGRHHFWMKYVEDEGSYQDACDDYFDCTSFEVCIYPFVIPDRFWNGTDIIIELSVPEGTTGTVSAYRNKMEYDDETGGYDDVKGELIATVNVTDGEINLGRFDPSDYEKVWFEFSDENVNLWDNELESYVYLNIISDNPDWDIELEYDSEMIKADERRIDILNMPDSVFDDRLVFLIDNEEFEFYYTGYAIEFSTVNLTDGSHSFEIRYLGDSYFHPANKTGSFNVVGWTAEIPDTYDMGIDDERIVVTLPDNAEGTLIVKANGTEIFTRDFNEEEVYDNKIEIYASLKGLKYGMNDVIVIVTGNYAGNKTAQINATYNMEIPSEFVRYGEKKLYIDCPGDIESTITLTIEGTTYNVLKEVVYYASAGEVFRFYAVLPGDLSIGNHTATISYAGDKKYPQRNFTDEFTVAPVIIVPGGVLDEDNDEIILVLPANPQGVLNYKLKKYIGGEPTLIADSNVSFVDGVAKHSFADLPFGKYVIYANYTGSDYVVFSNDPDDGTSFTVNPVLSCPSKMIEGDNKYISINLPGTTGSLQVEVDGEDYATVDLVNGKASIGLNKLSAGSHSIFYIFDETFMVKDDENYTWEESESYYGYFDVTVQRPAIKAANAAVYYTSGVYNVQITGVDKSLITGDKVTFKVNGKVIGTGAIDKNGYASVRIAQLPGTYKITATYKKASVTRTLLVRHIVTLKPVVVKRSASFIILQSVVKVGTKPVANQRVAFKFNGYNFFGKTNKLGVAKVVVRKAVINKLKPGRNVVYQATYLKDTVKRVAKVYK